MVRTEKGVLPARAKIHLGLTGSTYFSATYTLSTYYKPRIVAAMISKNRGDSHPGETQPKNSVPQKLGTQLPVTRATTPSLSGCP